MTAREPSSTTLDIDDLFGLRSRPVTGAVIVLGVMYVVVTVGSGLDIDSVLSWVGLTVAFGILAVDVVAMTRIPGHRLPYPAGVLGVVLMVAGTALALWSLPMDTFEPAQVSPSAVTGIVVLALLAVRGRLGPAWTGAVALTLSAGIWGAGRGLGFATGAGYTTWVYPVMIFATLFAVMLRPMARSIVILRTRAVRFAADDAAALAVAEERDRQLAQLERRARPLLEQVAGGHEFSAAEVARARLVEAELRDGIRAPSWGAARVRDAVWQARERGINVVLLDDGTTPLAPAVQSMLDDTLVAELDGLDDGRVTARVLPQGRAIRATVVVNSGGVTRRHDFTDHGRDAAEHDGAEHVGAEHVAAGPDRAVGDRAGVVGDASINRPDRPPGRPPTTGS
ncbi:hypothetical protein AAFP35_05745 [Gordonia sp. CPCC 206044]|uniref:hypothetical protein n=1 Tax=Gordonia sp. CPCC 206044 TaxID=3140793 RepID=UPI003AF34B43